MTLEEFRNGICALWNIDGREYLACINQEDREFRGDQQLWSSFRLNPAGTFVRLPTQDQERVFALITRRKP